ncbi:hypothetical protein CP533_3566 [Ophiocordyceps camponoti-saundersi (nom. inval.)]|nr:hypothetical protein CP533_3566 [Ophiocordyceps camponoti-saundersi (nom. inval.)]
MIRSLALLALAGATTRAAAVEPTTTIQLYQGRVETAANGTWGLSVITAGPEATTYEGQPYPATCTPGASGCEPQNDAKYKIVTGPKTYSFGYSDDKLQGSTNCDVDLEEDTAACNLTIFKGDYGQSFPRLVRNYKAGMKTAYVTAGVEKLKSGSPATASGAVARKALVAGLAALVGTVVFC